MTHTPQVQAIDKQADWDYILTKLMLKTRNFARWANDEGITDADLCAAIDEMERGLVDANLGGNVYKKRVALQGRGKRGGGRTIVASNLCDKWFFMYGFSKNEMDTISRKTLMFIKAAAIQLLARTEEDISILVAANELGEVLCPENPRADS